MKSSCALLFFFMLANISFGQIEKFQYKAASDRFEENYNADKYEAIYSDFSAEMQKALPLDKATVFFSGLKQEAGKIQRRQFAGYNQPYAIYKTHFERTLFAIHISIDNNNKINGLFIDTYKESDLPKMGRNKTKLILPFNGEWTVLWGGDTKDLNYHVESEAQKNAFDFLIIDEQNKSFKTEGEANEDYYAFGKEIIAPCDGEIVQVVDGIPDNNPGEVNPMFVPGNTVILKTTNSEFLVFAHFKQNSILVKQGQRIKQGQLLGLCGNSGNSTEPHLHFHLQNVEDLNVATGVKCYFDEIQVNETMKKNYSPIKNDKIININK